MVMTQYGTAHDRKIGIGADKVMRELPHKVKQPRESLFVYFHGNVSAVEDNAVLIVIDIGRILEKPAFCAEIERNNAVVRPARMTYPAGIALVFKAELAQGVGSRLAFSGSRYIARILLRLGEIDSDVQLAVFAVKLPGT